MEGYKDLKIHQNINVKLTTEKPEITITITGILIHLPRKSDELFDRRFSV